ncbi:MAG: hypothetical protein V3V61_02875 [Gammaproteobacteria bacterium]
MRDTKWRTFIFGIVLACWTCLSNASDLQTNVTYLDQGWDEIRQPFYFTPQGSRMIPVKWFMALEAINVIF